MVRRTIEERGISDARVLDAMRTVERERFIGADQGAAAYEDHPLPIGAGQTISQPYVVAAMAEAATIESDDRVLEVGTGSGYGAAVLAQLAAEVTTVERIPELAARARHALAAVHIHNVEVCDGDGTLGWPPGAPFDAIVVTAATPTVPPALLEQLGTGAHLVIPVGPRGHQRLLCLRRQGNGVEQEDLGAVSFVPLIGNP